MTHLIGQLVIDNGISARPLCMERLNNNDVLVPYFKPSIEFTICPNCRDIRLYAMEKEFEQYRDLKRRRKEEADAAKVSEAAHRLDGSFGG